VIGLLHLYAAALAAGAALPAAMPHDHDAKTMAMTGVFGDYPMTRDASGTSWLPDASVHAMDHVMRGDWTLMGHAMLEGVYDWQEGPRGDELAFTSGMVMASARRDARGGDTLNFRAMLSPDPFMGKRGYPLLLASGETADGMTPLIDRQHPHDLFMELSASFAWQLGIARSLFVYAGLPASRPSGRRPSCTGPRR
jgi:hypothetical protein